MPAVIEQTPAGIQVAAAQLAAEVKSLTRKHSTYKCQADKQHPLQRSLLELFFTDAQQLRVSIQNLGPQRSNPAF